MVRQLLSIVLLAIINNCVAQTYHFDYALEIEFKDSAKADVRQATMYVNSLDNTFAMDLVYGDEANCAIRFLHDNVVAGKGNIVKREFNEAETISMNCDGIFAFPNPSKAKSARNYEFLNLQDTIIDGISYAHYVLKPVNQKRAKRKKLGSMHYIVYKDVVFTSPVFHSTAVALSEWQVEKNVPQRLFKMRYFVNHQNAVDGSVVVKSFRKETKKVIIDCNVRQPVLSASYYPFSNEISTINFR